MKQGDYVVRRSYGGDVLFRIDAFRQQTAILKGTDYRLLADAPLNDLTVVHDPDSTVATLEVRIKEHESMRRFREQSKSAYASPDVEMERMAPLNVPAGMTYFDLPGKILHLDGDGHYLRKSMQLYGQMRIPAHGIHSHESLMADILRRMLPQLHPDIVVITGHDGVYKQQPSANLSVLSSYKNSQNFVNAVRAAREYDRSRDSLVVVAGACQSHFEALLQAGANFASSPGRILIHALDPVYVAIQASKTPIRETVNLADVIRGTISGTEGMGGVDTLGKYRMGMPKPKIVEKPTQIAVNEG
jgi:spore coat assemly protein